VRPRQTYYIAAKVLEHLAGIEDYVLAEAVWPDAIARWHGPSALAAQVVSSALSARWDVQLGPMHLSRREAAVSS
jgi:hypothetical protein